MMIPIRAGDTSADMFESPGGNAEFNEYLSYFLDQDRLKGKRKILIVEDDALSAIYLKTLIKDFDENKSPVKCYLKILEQFMKRMNNNISDLETITF